MRLRVANSQSGIGRMRESKVSVCHPPFDFILIPFYSLSGAVAAVVTNVVGAVNGNTFCI